MTQRVKPLLIRALVEVLLALLPIKPSTELGKAVEHSPSTWAIATHVGDQDGFLGS